MTRSLGVFGCLEFPILFLYVVDDLVFVLIIDQLHNDSFCSHAYFYDPY